MFQIPIGVIDEEKEESHTMSSSIDSDNRSLFSREQKQFDGKKQRTTSISVRGNESEFIEERRTSSVLARCWNTLDDSYLRPLLTSSKPTLVETLPECWSPCARLFTSYEQTEYSSLSASRNSNPNDGVEENEVFDLSYTEVGGKNSMVCSAPSNTMPLLNSNPKIQEYNAGFTS